MMTLGSDNKFSTNPKIIRAIEILFIVKADNGIDNTTASVRHLSSAFTDLCATLSAAFSAL